MANACASVSRVRGKAGRMASFTWRSLRLARNCPDQHHRGRPPRSHRGHHRRTGPRRGEHPRHRPGGDSRHPVVRHPGGNPGYRGRFLGPQGRAVHRLQAGPAGALHPGLGRGLPAMGRRPGQGAAHRDPAHPPGDCRATAEGQLDHRQVRAEHRPHRPSLRTHAAGHARRPGQGLHRVLGTRRTGRSGGAACGIPQRRPGIERRHRFPAGQRVSPQPPAGGVRHGFDADRGGSHRRTGQGRRCRREGRRDHRAGDAR